MELKITRTMSVTPAEPTWGGSLTLSELDQICCTTHAAVIFFYSGPTPTPFNEITDTLAESLSRALVHFYPLAGRLRRVPHGGGRFELLCNGKGAAFVAAELDAELSDFGDFTPTPDFDKYLFPEIGRSDDDVALLLAQVTRFKCGGVSLALRMSHVVCDGRSATKFVMEWAQLARGKPLSAPPLMDRTVPRGESRFNHAKDLCCLPYLIDQPGPEELEKMKVTMLTQRLSRDQVEKLTKAANRDNNGVDARPFSRYETVAAHLWRCCSKAREHRREQPTACIVTIDVRRRTEPPIPQEFFGNAVFDLAATCLAGDLESRSLAYGASRIRAEIGRATGEYVSSLMDFLQSERDVSKYQLSFCSSKNGGGKFAGNPNVGVVSWLNLPFQGTDFGWGGEVHFGPGNHGVDGDSWIIGSRNGDGSLKVVTCLLQQHVESFKKHFYEDIHEYCKSVTPI